MTLMTKHLGNLPWPYLPLVLSLSVLAGCTQVHQTIAVGEMIGDIDVVQLSGKREKLSSLSKDRITLVVFWATWCQRCREEVPDINDLAADYGSSLAVIGISAGETLHTVKAHSAGLGIRYPVVVTQLSNLAALGIDSIPRLVVLDSKGRIQRIENGVNTSLRARLTQLAHENEPNQN
ncbi:MAG: TlpA disulfide reductase family protein [Candidatus Poribacteria bacterium]|nr:TlpA disulfide reductase family protein [Candidatus Poribacteria bacterium]